MSWNEKPPILTGQTQRDVANIRDYLFRMAGSLTEAAQTVDSIVSYDAKGRQILAKGGATAQAIKNQADELKSLILKTANTVRKYADSKIEEYNALYVAQSDFGDYMRQNSAIITQTAEGVVENYNYNETILAPILGDIEDLQAYQTVLEGEIRRGVIEDPTTHQDVLGIAISQHIDYAGSGDVEQGGNTYYRISGNQTFGFYTSTGWQFWISGIKRAWLDTVDGEMHIQQLTIEDSLKMGQNWEIRHGTNSWGVKFIGG